MLSIVVPVYNVEEYVSQCIESILAQTYSDFELLLIDDGSTDRSGEICERYGKEDSRVRVVHQANSGSVRARNVGITLAQRDYIAFVDSDDWIERDMYEKLMALIGEGNELAICNYCLEFGNRAETFENKLTYTQESGARVADLVDMSRYFRFAISPSMCNKVFLRSRLRSLTDQVDPQIAMGDDAALVFPYVANTSKIGLTHEALYHYRQRVGSITHAYRPDMPAQIEALVTHMEVTMGSRREYRRQMELYAYFVYMLTLKNESLKDAPLCELAKTIRLRMHGERISKIVGETKLPASSLFDGLLDHALKWRAYFGAAVLLRRWKMHASRK